MTMNRVIHAAVRRDLLRLSTALTDWQDGDCARGVELERAFANLHAELHHHHEGEDTHIWPMLATVGVDQHLLDTMESEHSAMAQALTETGRSMAAVAGSGSATDAAAARATSWNGTTGTRRPSSSRSWPRTRKRRSGTPSRRSCAASRCRSPGGSSPG